MQKDLILIRRDGLIEACVHEEIVALHVESGLCYAFNSTASWIWKFIDRPRSLTELISALTSAFDVAPHELEREVWALLSELESHCLLRIEQAPQLA